MRTNVRVKGSGFTILRFNTQPISLLTNFQDGGQTPVGRGAGPGYSVIHPLDNQYPAEVVTSNALNAGELTATVMETWDEHAWERLPPLQGLNDKLEIFERMRDPDLEEIQCQKVIRSPNGKWRQTLYVGCFIVNVDDTDSARIGDLEQERPITMIYRKRKFSTTESTAS